MHEDAETEGRPFLDTGLDFSVEEFDPDEKAAMLAWYEDVHNYGGLDLAPFARFWIENDPGGFKRLKRHLLTLDEAVEGVALPVSVGVLLFVHTYTAIGNGKGAFYEIVAARALGINRREVLEVVRSASLFGGPVGMNPLSEVIGRYFEEWVDDSPTGSPWPDGWTGDVGRFRSGIDHATNELLPGELDLIVRWHESVYGEVPSHLPRLAVLHPTALKTQLIRQEAIVTGDLPAQVIPLLHLHLAVARMQPTMIRRAVQMARSLGVRRHQVVSALFWASVAGGSLVLEQAYGAIDDILDEMA
jgi:hypothetical protein